MTNLRTRKSKLAFETDAEIRERGRSRSVLVEATPYIAYVRLKGTRHSLPIAWDDIYATAAKRYADRAKAEKQSKKGKK